MRPFIVDIRKIEGVNGASLDCNLAWSPEGLDLARDRAGFVGDVRFRGSVSNIGGAYLVDGRIAGAFSAACDRCLKQFTSEFDLPLTRLFAEAGYEQALDDADIETLNGLEIDLGPHIREEVVLSMPIRLLCEDSCKGICPGCGVDLNDGECICGKSH